MTTTTIQEQVAERKEDFELSLGHHGSVEEGMTRSIETIFEILQLYFGEEIVEGNFNRLISDALLPRGSKTARWRETLHEHSSSLFFETAGGVRLFHLVAYAEQGVVLATARDVRQREAMLTRWVEEGKRLLELLPLDQWNLDEEYLVRVIRMASARWKIDNGQPVTAEELALLSGKALQTIRNKLAAKPSEIGGNQSRIEAADAAAWLSRQKNFKTSIWQSQDDSDASDEPDPFAQEFLFVPLATDGTVFHQGLLREGKYFVGGEGDEQELADFDEALLALQNMFAPQWRRPTPEGRWTRVRGIEWKRIPKDELTSMARPSAD